jgi:hypothetical protein
MCLLRRGGDGEFEGPLDKQLTDWERTWTSVRFVTIDVGGAGLCRPVRLAYQPPASSTFLSEQTRHQQTASSTFLSEQISTSHQPPAKRTGCVHVPPPTRWGRGVWRPTRQTTDRLGEDAACENLRGDGRGFGSANIWGSYWGAVGAIFPTFLSNQGIRDNISGLLELLLC